MAGNFSHCLPGGHFDNSDDSVVCQAPADDDSLYVNEPLYQIYHQGAVVREVISQNAVTDDDVKNGSTLHAVVLELLRCFS